MTCKTQCSNTVMYCICSQCYLIGLFAMLFIHQTTLQCSNYGGRGRPLGSTMGPFRCCEKWTPKIRIGVLFTLIIVRVHLSVAKTALARSFSNHFGPGLLS